MKNVKINGKERLSFIVKDGDAALIVIPIDILAPVDYKRMAALEAKGGEMMRIMRDEMLDNGMNCLTQYQHLLIVVPKDNKPAVSATAETVAAMNAEKPAPKKRGPKPKVKPAVVTEVPATAEVPATGSL